MRANGIGERFCTGDATDREKFDAFASTLPYLLRNPLYHWCHLELARYFQIDDLLLGPRTADEVWERSSAVVRSGLSARSLIERSKVLALCTGGPSPLRPPPVRGRPPGRRARPAGDGVAPRAGTAVSREGLDDAGAH